MGSIVFKTIKENVSSFFGKEEELLHQPKPVPEAASEVFEHPQPRQPKQIIEQPLSDDDVKLPVTPDDLRKALKIKEAPPVEKPPVEQPTAADMSEFEQAFDDVRDVPVDPRPTAPPSGHRQPGFFDEFEQFLVHENLEPDDLANMDIVHRMKEFHRHRRQGKEYYVHSKDVQRAVERKLAELKTLEHEWFHTREQMDEMEQGLSGLEKEIETRTSEMKNLLHQAKSTSFLERKVPAGREFLLADGRRLSSLIELKIALHTMTDEIFKHHVTGKQNDFSMWIRTSLRDKELANKVKKIREKSQLDTFLGSLTG